MTTEIAMTTLTCLVGVMVMILLAGVPWAYSVHGRLTLIETTLRDQLRLTQRVEDLSNRVTRLEISGELGLEGGRGNSHV